MRAGLLELVACPRCYASLVAQGEVERGHLWHGTLICQGCGARYIVRNGIPRLYVNDEHWTSKAREAQGWIDYHKDKGIYDQTGVEIDFVLPYYDQEPWLSVAQHFDVALELMSLDGSETVLDLGAARTWAAKHFALRGCEVVALDIVADDQIGLGRGWALMERAGVEYHLVVGDSENLPLQPDSFDFVFAAAVLHHVSDLPLLLRNVYRVLKPGGALVAVNEPCISVSANPQHVLEQDAAEELAYGINENRPNLFDYLSALGDAALTAVDVFPIQAYRLNNEQLRAWAMEMNVIATPLRQIAPRQWPRVVAGYLQRWRDLWGKAHTLPPARSRREALNRAILLHRGGSICLLARKPADTTPVKPT
jgi:ubiquinone/menaquinone biosynthesis C-methylase UbiE/uncharacterized protein YbaR (Trm112 family)